MILFAAKPRRDEASDMNSNTMHSEYFVKTSFSAFIAIVAALSGLGGMLTEAETRYTFLVVTACVMTSGFVSLAVKTPEEKMRKVIGRCAIAIWGGFIGTHPVIHWLKIESTDTNALLLLFIASVVSVLMYFIGHAFILLLSSKSGEIADDILTIVFRGVKRWLKREPK